MPPKRVTKGKLHVLAPEVAQGTVVTDVRTKKQYSIGKQFATGGFGRIYTCNEVGKTTELVIKVEPSGNGPLFTEVNVFQRLLRPEQIQEYQKSKKLKWLGVPVMICAGVFDYKNEKLRFLIMPKYATSLESIREKKKVFTVSQTLNVTLSILRSLEYIHSKFFTHADIKAANILLERLDDYSTATLVDFGLARLSSSNEEKPDKKRAHNGTAIFTSLDAHRGLHPSYRGDIEILAYNIIYWLTGSLPWVKYESDPAKVQVEKEAFLKNVDASVKSVLSSFPQCQKVVCEFFKMSASAGYTKAVDMDKLYKLVENAMKGAPSEVVAPAAKPAKVKTPSNRKRASASDETEPEEKPKVTRSVKKRKELNEDVESDKEDGSVADEVTDTPKKAVAVRRGARSRTENRPTLSEATETDEDTTTTKAATKGSSALAERSRTRATPRAARTTARAAKATVAVDVTPPSPAPQSPRARGRLTAGREVASSSSAARKVPVVVSPLDLMTESEKRKRRTALAKKMKDAYKSTPKPGVLVVPGLKNRILPSITTSGSVVRQTPVARLRPKVPVSPSPEYSDAHESLSPPPRASGRSSTTRSLRSSDAGSSGTADSTELSKTPAGKRRKTPEKIPSDVKKSPNKLRAMVPGVRNFPKGRRSILIQQISNKYKRMSRKSILAPVNTNDSPGAVLDLE